MEKGHLKLAKMSVDLFVDVVWEFEVFCVNKLVLTYFMRKVMLFCFCFRSKQISVRSCIL